MTSPPDSARRLSRALPLLVAGCFFMENLDATIVTTAAPSIARDLRVDAPSVGLVITTYVMTVAVLIPISGWLADRFGSRRVLLMAITLFTVASIACAASETLPLLVLARIVQGIGGAMMVPVGRLTVLRETRKPDLIRTVALLTWPALAAPVIAPFLGGVLSTYLSWHWIFLVNVPIGAVGLVVGWRILPRPAPFSLATPAPHSPDWVGMGITSVGIACVVWVAAMLTVVPLNFWLLAVVGAVGAGCLAFAVWHLLHTAAPFVDLRLLRTHTYGVALGGGSVYRLVISAIPFVLALFFQQALGWSPVIAGTAVLLLFVGNLGIKPATTGLLRRLGFRRLLFVSHLVGAAVLIGMALFRAETPFALIALALLLSGIVRSTGFTAYNTITYADIEPIQLAGATVLDSTVQQVAVGFGVAFGAVAITIGTLIAATAHRSLTDGYSLVFLLLSGALILAAIPAWRLSPDAGRHLTHG